MDSLESALQGLSARSAKLRAQSLSVLRERLAQLSDEQRLASVIPRLARKVAQGGYELRDRALQLLVLAAKRVSASVVAPSLVKLLPVLAQIAAQPAPPYDALELLLIAARAGVDISVCIPALDKVGRTPEQAGLRGIVKTILSAHYEGSGRPRPLVARGDLTLPENWSLEEVNPHCVYAEPRVASRLPCGVCGSQRTVRIYERNDSVGCEISGIREIWNEIECLECGNFTVYHYYDQWSPAD